MKWKFDAYLVNPGDVWFYPWENQNAVRASLSIYAKKRGLKFVTHKVEQWNLPNELAPYLKVEYIGPRDESTL